MQAFVMCIAHFIINFFPCRKFYSTIRKVDAKVKLLIVSRNNGEVGNTSINSGLCRKKKRLALSFKYFMSISQTF